MGGASTGGGGGGVGPAGVRVSKKGTKTYGTKKDAKKTSSRNEFGTFIKEGGITGAIIKSITDTNKKTKAKKQANVEVGLGTDRMSNYTVGQGGTRETGGNDGGGNNNTPTVKVATIPKVTTAPTEAEVSQSAATDTTTVEEPKKVDDIYTRKRKAKARGRSMMTLTGPRGLKKDDKLTLGRPSLLGS